MRGDPVCLCVCVCAVRRSIVASVVYHGVRAARREFGVQMPSAHACAALAAVQSVWGKRRAESTQAPASRAAPRCAHRRRPWRRATCDRAARARSRPAQYHTDRTQWSLILVLYDDRTSTERLLCKRSATAVLAEYRYAAVEHSTSGNPLLDQYNAGSVRVQFKCNSRSAVVQDSSEHVRMAPGHYRTVKHRRALH